MARIIGYNSPSMHTKTCPKCGAMIEFSNEDILRDDMGLCIVCPNCNNDIKF